MTLHKNRYPILEYDSDTRAVIMPDTDIPARLPDKGVVTFSNYARQYARQVQAKIHSEFVSVTKIFKIYITEYEGHNLCFCDVPAGASAAVQLVDYLFFGGVTRLIASGSCGTLIDLPENEILIPVRALRDEGASYHYLKADRFIDLHPKAIAAIEQALNKAGRSYRKCTTWSSDGFFRETKKMVDYRKKEGCQVVEMECSALAACARFRKGIFGQILFSGDSLAHTAKHEQRNWGAASVKTAFQLSLDAVIHISS
jgi:uridine phosphorylase